MQPQASAKAASRGAAQNQEPGGLTATEPGLRESLADLAPAISPPPKPQLVPPRIVHRPSRAKWWLLGIIILLAGAAILYRQRYASPSATTPSTAASVRTAKIAMGTVERTIRLTGVTGAENFASLITPQLRGSQSDRGRDFSGGSNASSTTTAIPSLSGGNSSAASSSSSSTGTSGGSGGQNNLSSALRAATSRFGGSAPSTSSTGSNSGGSTSGGSAAGTSGTSTGSSSTSGSTSTAMGSTGLGSTAASLNAGTGGGGGGGTGNGDFMLVLQKLAKPGSHVKKGEVVAEFDRQNMLLRLDDYRASVLQHQASVRRLRSDLDVQRKAHDQSIATAKGDLDKVRLDLKTLPVLSDMDIVRTKLAVEEAEAKYRNLVAEAKLVETSIQAQIRDDELDLQQSQIELKRAETNADRMLIKAPIDGLTVMQQIPRGGELAQVQEGDQLWPGIMFMTIVDTRSMVVNANVNQVDVERLRIGAKARVRFDAYPDLVLPAHVFSLGGIAKSGGMRGDFVKEIPVRLKLDATDPRVIPDLSVSADVVLESEAREAAVAPAGAVFRDGPSAAPFVFVQNPSGWVRREVELGVTSNIAAAVRSGLHPGDVVALDRPRATPQTEPRP